MKPEMLRKLADDMEQKPYEASWEYLAYERASPCTAMQAFLKLTGGFRIRPRVEYVERTIRYPKPVSEPLEEGREYWAVAEHGIVRCRWKSSTVALGRLKAGRIHLTKEAAQEHWDALWGESDENSAPGRD